MSSWTQNSEDPWSTADPWQQGSSRSSSQPQVFAPKPAAASSATSEDFSGHYIDTWADNVVAAELKRTLDGVKVIDASRKYDDENGKVQGDRISFWGLNGKLIREGNDFHLDWDNGCRWTRTNSQAASASASWQAAPAATNDSDASGHYIDTRKGGKPLAELTFNGSSVTVKDTSGTYPDEDGKLSGDRISFWGLNGTLRSNAGSHQIEWDNKSVWAREAPDGAQADVASSSAWGAWNTTAEGSGAAANGSRGAPAASGWTDHSGGLTEEAELEKKKASRQRELQTYQDWYASENTLPGKTDQEFEIEENTLFANSGASHEGEGIDFSLYDLVTANTSGPKCEQLQPLTSFTDLETVLGTYMPQELMANIKRCGYTKPTPVQKQAIPAALLGRDVMVCAQTGSGKTAAFLIPVLASMMRHNVGVGGLTEPFKGNCSPDALVMSPTRELCVQIYEEALRFCHRSPFRCVRLYGQESVKTQIGEVAKGADLIIATPGRLYDFVSTGIVVLDKVATLVLDEADRMMEMNQDQFFREVIESHGMPAKDERQTMMFSATFPESIQKIAADYLYEHIWVGVGTIGTPAITVTQNFVKVKREDKLDVLVEIINKWLDTRSEEERMIVFTNSKLTAKGLNEQLWDKHFDCGALHGDLDQKEREMNLEKLKSGAIDVLVATDLASRGLDIRRVRQIVNYDLPREIQVYVQRIGRTGRIGHRGNATTFVAVDQDGNFLDSEEVIEALPSTLEENKQGYDALPDWLKEKAEQLKTGKWNYADDKVDARNGDAWGSWEAAKANDAGWSTPATDGQSAWTSKPYQ